MYKPPLAITNNCYLGIFFIIRVLSLLFINHSVSDPYTSACKYI